MGNIDFWALKRFCESLDGHMPIERISAITQMIGDELRDAGVQHQRLGNLPVYYGPAEDDWAIITDDEPCPF